MLAENRSALKEWAAIETVLAAGATTLLLRKGGIWERREGFEVEHREFWLFPTRYHQNPSELDPRFAWALASASAEPHDVNQVRIEHYAVVEDAFKVERLEALERLGGLHTLTADTVRSRFAYRGRPYLHALVVRVQRLPIPHRIPNTLDYEGCVSWVELEESLPTAGAVPVLGDAEFAAAREAILERLGTEGVTRL